MPTTPAKKNLKRKENTSLTKKDVLEKPTRVGLAGHTSVDCNFVVRIGIEFKSFDESWELYQGEIVVLVYRLFRGNCDSFSPPTLK